MSRSPIVDAHVHVLPVDPSGAEPVREPYEIWEYGEVDGVEVLEVAGTIEEVTEAMTRASCDHFVAVNLFVVDNELARGTHRDEMEDKLRGFNAWVLDVAASREDMTAFVAADPHVLGGTRGADHLVWAQERGARGIKIHPVAQAFLPDDPAMDDSYRVCEELGLAVIAHAGASRGATEWAQPDAYANVLRDHEELHLVLAHLGGARWRQAADLAETFPNVAFDLCEIVAWAGAPGAPTKDQLAKTIKDIGPERVLFGTDFPWYDVEKTIDQVMDLPYLAREEKEGILGANAVRILGLPVAV